MTRTTVNPINWQFRWFHCWPAMVLMIPLTSISRKLPGVAAMILMATFLYIFTFWRYCCHDISGSYTETARCYINLPVSAMIRVSEVTSMSLLILFPSPPQEMPEMYSRHFTEHGRERTCRLRNVCKTLISSKFIYSSILLIPGSVPDVLILS